MPAQINSLTALRGYAAFGVISFHYFYLGHIYGLTRDAYPLVHGVLTKFYFSVDIFFMLSGFIIPYVYLEMFEKEGLNDRTFVTFIVRRIARIYPLHLITLLTLAAFGYFGLGDAKTYNWDMFAKNLFLVHGWQYQRPWSWNSPTWSVSVEWAMYLLFPFLLVVLDAGKHWAFVLTRLALLLGLLYWFNDRFHHTTMDYTFDQGLIRGLFEFCMGFCIYTLYRQRFLAQLPWNAISCGTMLALAAGALYKIDDVAMIVGIILLIYSLTYASGSFDRIFSNSFAVLLGMISYSIYLWHMPLALFIDQFYELCKQLLPFREGGEAFRFTAIGLYLGIILVVSCLSYRFIEKPARKMVQGWQETLSDYLARRARMKKTASG